MFNISHIHPMMVHFPIAILMVGFLADLIYLFFKEEKCLSKTGFYLLIIGATAAIAAYISGTFFTNHPTEGAIVPVFENHELFALLTMISALVTLLFRAYAVIKHKEDKFKWIVFVLYAITAIFVSLTGFLGGTMVYNYMMPI